MGAKAPLSQRLRRGGFKCEYCGRALSSMESLRAHQRVLHAVALKQKQKDKGKIGRPKRIQKSQKVVPVKSNVKNIEVNELQSSLPHRAKMSAAQAKVQKTPSVESPILVESDKKVEFKCLKCDKSFPSNFSLTRHMKKGLCGVLATVKSNQDAVKSILIDIAQEEARPDPKSIGPAASYMCIECKQPFATMKMFDVHISSLHCEGVESMFFPTKEEYSNWKTEMERNTNISYTLMENYSTKQVYRCAYTFPMTDYNTSIVKYCPSTIISQEFPKGIQVHFYKKHSSHSVKPYVLTDKYKTYSITGLLVQASSYNNMSNIKDGSTPQRWQYGQFKSLIENISDVKGADIPDKWQSNDLYLEFKTLMESIVMDAAKINIDTLKILLEKALEMTSILTNYDEDDEGELMDQSHLKISSTKSLTDKNNASRPTRTGKREVPIVTEPPAKKTKPTITKESKPTIISNEVIPTITKEITPKSTRELKTVMTKEIKPKIVNSFSLADNRDSDKILKELGSAQNKKSQQKSVTESVKQTNDKPIHSRLSTEQSLSSFNDSYKSFIDNNFVKKAQSKKTAPEPKKKMIVKTKMGQFKPNTPPKSLTSPNNSAKTSPKTYLSPKAKATITPVKAPAKIVTPKSQITRSSLKEKSRSSYTNVKEIKYEVKEQENDCNILILKI